MLKALLAGLRYTRSGQLICSGGHFEKVAFSGGLHLPMEIEASPW